jgi:cell division protein FtsI/penicillin-binding protein 2
MLAMACGESRNLSFFFRRRQRLLLFFFYSWIVIVLLRLSDIMVFSREKILRDLSMSQNVEVVKPALRGSIYLESGELLAWSEPCFQLLWWVPSDLVEQRLQLEKIYNLLDVKLLEFEAGQVSVVCYELDGNELSAALELVKGFDSFSIKEYYKRMSSCKFDWLGTVENGHGISGVEKKYDAFLSGKNGVYHYATRRQKINYQTWNESQKLIPGQDLVVDRFGQWVREKK